MTIILSGEQVAVEKFFEIRKVDAVILQVNAALPLVPGIHALNVNAKRIGFKRGTSRRAICSREAIHAD